LLNFSVFSFYFKKKDKTRFSNYKFYFRLLYLFN